MQVGHKKIKIQIFDTCGQERYRHITQSFYKGNSGVILCYAVNDKKSFENCEYWLEEIEKHTPEDIVKVLAANKIDLPENEHVITTE